MKYTLFVRMFDQVFDDGRFVFTAKDQASANKIGSQWAGYHGMTRNDIMVKESTGLELNWTVEN